MRVCIGGLWMGILGMFGWTRSESWRASDLNGDENADMVNLFEHGEDDASQREDGTHFASNHLQG
jgi:hypothetical protein